MLLEICDFFSRPEFAVLFLISTCDLVFVSGGDPLGLHRLRLDKAGLAAFPGEHPHCPVFSASTQDHLEAASPVAPGCRGQGEDPGVVQPRGHVAPRWALVGAPVDRPGDSQPSLPLLNVKGPALPSRTRPFPAVPLVASRVSSMPSHASSESDLCTPTLGCVFVIHGDCVGPVDLTLFLF